MARLLDTHGLWMQRARGREGEGGGERERMRRGEKRATTYDLIIEDSKSLILSEFLVTRKIHFHIIAEKK